MLYSEHLSHQLLIHIRSTYNQDQRAYAIPDCLRKTRQEMTMSFSSIFRCYLCLSNDFWFFSYILLLSFYFLDRRLRFSGGVYNAPNINRPVVTNAHTRRTTRITATSMLNIGLMLLTSRKKLQKKPITFCIGVLGLLEYSMLYLTIKNIQTLIERTMSIYGLLHPSHTK